MGLIPSKAIERVQFYENKETGWASVATQIGTTTAAVTDLTTKTAAARAAYDAHQAAQDAARTATQAWHQAVVAMSIAGASIVDQIRAKAKISGDGIYTIANIPAPATPQPVTTLGKPSDFKVELSESGALDLSWKCVSPRATGVLYQIWRRIGATGSFEYLGGTGEKKYTDSTVPMGSSQVTYQIQAARSTASSPWAQFNVNFGMSGGGAMTTSVTEQPPSPKLAA